MIIPEIEIYKILNSIIATIKNNFNSTIDESKTILYQLLKDVSIEGFDFYEQAKVIFLRSNDYSRKLEIHLSFNAKRVNVPTIHITLPSEQSDFNGLGVDAGYEDNYYLSRNTVQNAFTRMFTSQYNLIITSDNNLEVLTIYHVIRAFIISSLDLIELNGLRNIKLSGQDLRLNNDSTPVFYAKGIGLSMSYEVTVPSIIKHELINEINFSANVKSE